MCCGGELSSSCRSRRIHSFRSRQRWQQLARWRSGSRPGVRLSWRTLLAMYYKRGDFHFEELHRSWILKEVRRDWSGASLVQEKGSHDSLVSEGGSLEEIYVSSIVSGSQRAELN